MPNNINHVVVGNETKLDLREDTVTPSTMVSGIVAHDASGARIVGTFDPSIYVLKAGDIMSGDLETPRVHHDEGTANNAYGYSLDKDGLTIEGNHISSDTYDKVFVEDTRIKLASGLYDADRDTNRTIITPSSINMYEYGDSTSIIREKVEISKDRIKIHNSSGGDTSIGKSELIIGNKDILRTHQSLVGGWFLTGTITSNSDLNTGALCKVGRWSCSTALAQTLTNCPVRTEFILTNHAPTQTGDLGNESGTWTYRVREIETWNGIKYRQFAQTAGTAGVWTFGAWQLADGANAINGTLTANTGSFSESYCRQAGRVVDIHAWLSNLSTNTQTHERAISVSGVALPSVPVRFVFTCWLNNGIAAYAGYGVLDTSGYFTFVKGVANSNKISFAISYVV